MSSAIAVIRPQSQACAAGMGEASSKRCRARAGPIISASRVVPIQPGIIPSVASGLPNLACLTAMRKSAAIASSSPPPSVWPLIAAITGCGRVAIFSNTSIPRMIQSRPMSCGVRLPQASISPPVQKKRPLARNTTARVSRSPRNSSAMSARRSSIGRVSALPLSGRFRVISAQQKPALSCRVSSISCSMVLPFQYSDQ